MKRVLLLIAFSFAIIALVAFQFNRYEKSAATTDAATIPPALETTADISLQLDGDHVLCEGRTVEPNWIQVWKKKIDYLIETDRDATTPKEPSTIKIQKRRLSLKLDPHLSYAVLQDLLMESATRGFINYEVVVGNSAAPVRFSLFPDAQELPDGKYAVLDVRITSNDKECLDETRFKSAVLQQQPIFLQIIPDSDVSIGQILRPVEIFSANSKAPLISLFATRTRSDRIRGEQSAKFEWTSRNVEIQNGREMIVIPPDILEKAQEGFRTTPDGNPQTTSGGTK